MSMKSPSVLARLSNLIVVQVVFVFGALALILFSPGADNDVRNHLVELHEQLLDRGAPVAGYFARLHLDGSAPADDELRRILDTIPLVDRAVLLQVRDTNSIAVLGNYLRNMPDDDTTSVDLSAHFDLVQVRTLAAEGMLAGHSSSVNNDYLSHYFGWLDESDSTPIVLAMAVGHDLSVASRSSLKAAILGLFVCSTLVSLLTVALLSRKFKRPLDHIISALGETAGGKTHLLTEFEDDPQLGRLVTAYNSMAGKLWDQRRRIDEYVTRLAEVNGELARREGFLANLIDCSPLPVIATDDRGHVLLFNKAATETFGYTRDEMVERDVRRLLANGDEVQRTPSEYGDSVEFEMAGSRADGEHFPLYVVARRIETEGGETGWLYVCRDITESKNFQEMMIRLDRYYTRGEMAGDIAHEINNYLAVLMGNVELMPLMLKKGKMDKVETKLGVMKDTLEKIARFSDGLLDSPPETVRLEPSVLNQIVENVIAFLRPQNRFDGVEISTELALDLAVLQLDRMQIQQLLVNLIYNAAEAVGEIEGEKRITISTRNAARDGESCAEIEVRDTGPGVRESKQESMFEARFTTKQRGHGTGLITCRKIVDNHDGEISYRYDGGAVFTVSLPVKETPPEFERFTLDGKVVSPSA